MSKRQFDVTILGCGSASPTREHTASSQVLNIGGEQYMIDCGECAQYQAIKCSNVSLHKIKATFISHIHGDHTFGMIGMIAAMGLTGRTKKLEIYAPDGVHQYLESAINLFCGKLTYDIEFHTTDTEKNQMIYESNNVEVWTIPLSHTKPCNGYLFKEKQGLPHINMEAIEKYQIPLKMINTIKNGADWTMEDGTVIDNSELVLPADKPRSYAYCADTAFKPDIAKMIKDVDVLYHEASFMDSEIENAVHYKHSTAWQAGIIAKTANAKKLYIGHLSSRYAGMEDKVLEEAQSEFKDSYLTNELMVIKIDE